MARVEEDEEAQLRRLRLPEGNELLGIVEEMKGGSRMLVRCSDNIIRLCRIPGKMKRRIWVKEGDIVIVKPWPVQGNEKGDIVWRYTKTQVDRLNSMGLLDFL